MLRILANGDHSNRLFGALRVRNETLVLIVLRATRPVLFYHSGQVNSLHIHGSIQWRAHTGVLRGVVVDGAIVGALAHALASFEDMGGVGWIALVLW
ncbi:MAG TPA: hypothetical protein HPP54_10630 [Nitrospinae bacterium]|nr:hypothetical protein [Nitrospinota bacterium]